MKYRLILNRYGIIRGLFVYLKFAGIATGISALPVLVIIAINVSFLWLSTASPEELSVVITFVLLTGLIGFNYVRDNSLFWDIDVMENIVSNPFLPRAKAFLLRIKDCTRLFLIHSLTRINPKWISLGGWDLSEANLSGINLEGLNLSQINFSRANLTDTNLSNVNLHYAFLNRANLRGANLSGADLSDAQMRGAILSNTSFLRANLSRADLTMADLSGANLLESNLTAVILTGAKITRVLLEGTGTTANIQIRQSSTRQIANRLIQRGAILGDADDL